MKTAIIIHGMPDKKEYEANPDRSLNHWFPWLKKELEHRGYGVHIPRMPEPYAPAYEKWQEVFEQLHVDQETILVGHSCGAGFLVRWLSEHDLTVGQVLLVAPWIDPNHEEREAVGDFFDFSIDQNLSEKTKGITVFVSTDDEKPVLDSVEVLKIINNITIREFTNKGHFTSEDGVLEFPELLENLAA
jgi:predicted alpha/beta hydrolase family esterase